MKLLQKVLATMFLFFINQLINATSVNFQTIYQETAPGILDSVNAISITNQYSYASGGISITWKNDYSILNETVTVTLENKNANVSGVSYKYELIKESNGAYTIRVFKTTLSLGLLAIPVETEASASDVIVHVEMHGTIV